MSRPRVDLGAELDGFLATFDFAAHRRADPIAFVHRYDRPADQEVVAFFSALLAYGRADLIARALRDVVDRIGEAPADAAMSDDEAAALRRFEGFVYRLTRGPDLARLWLGLGRLRARHGSIGSAALALDASDAPDLRPLASRLREAIRAPTAHFPYRRAFEHLFPNPAGASASKRVHLLLRWMVRGPDAVDLGLWRGLGTHRLLMPVDTHVHRIGRYLGLTRRSQGDIRTAVEITEGLRRLDPTDPLRYDFALAHMGISGRCPTRRVAAICAECPIRSICRIDARGRIAGRRL
jgi:uncharacterized protein (TIGR02757 family)